LITVIVCWLAQGLKSIRRKDKVTEITALIKTAKTDKQKVHAWNEIMEIQSWGNCPEVTELIEAHIKKFRS
jgi:hypothetical protein